MNKEFVPYEEALVLKELGFDEPCWAWWHIEDCDTRFCYSEQRSPIINSIETEVVGLPTYSSAFRWFREKHNLIAYPQWRIDNTWDITIQQLDGYGLLSGQTTLSVIKKSTYEEAELECLKKLIEIAKK